MQAPEDLSEILALNEILFSILLMNIERAFVLLGFASSFGQLFPVIRSMISRIWLMLTQHSDLPKYAQGSLKLEGGLSLL